MAKLSAHGVILSTIMYGSVERHPMRKIRSICPRKPARLPMPLRGSKARRTVMFGQNAKRKRVMRKREGLRLSEEFDRSDSALNACVCQVILVI